MLAPDSSPVTVPYHLYSVSSGRCRVTIPGRHLEEGSVYQVPVYQGNGKNSQDARACSPYALYKTANQKINRRQEPPASLFHTLTVETRQKRSLGTSQYSHLVICQITFKSSQRASSPVRGSREKSRKPLIGTQARFWRDSISCGYFSSQSQTQKTGFTVG